MTIESGTSLAHHEVSSPRGKGGMGEVFRARDTKLGREAKLLASLNHPNVAAIHGFEDVSGLKFLVMELAHGETLADRIRRGPIPVDEALAIAKPIAQALEAARLNGRPVAACEKSKNCAMGGRRRGWSGRGDSNSRPPEPHSGALPGCATARH
jgi:serine/threonine protein kinase